MVRRCQTYDRQMPTYLVTDIDVDGLMSGQYSMISIHSVAVDARGAELGRFTVNLAALPEMSPDPGRLCGRTRSRRHRWQPPGGLVVRPEARPQSSERTAEDMLEPVDALVTGAERLAEMPEIPRFLPVVQTRVGVERAQSAPP
jgi:hypothetical protein